MSQATGATSARTTAIGAQTGAIFGATAPMAGMERHEGIAATSARIAGRNAATGVIFAAIVVTGAATAEI
jgi:hypothetical protein